MVILLKKLFNLNSYEWWRNHRRFITLGIFLAVFASYIRNPSSNEFMVRDVCARLNSSYQITGTQAVKKLKLISQSDISDRTLANYYCERYLGLK